MDRRTKLLLVLSVCYLVFLLGMVVLSLYLFLEEPAEPEPEPEPEPNDGHMSPLGHLHAGSFGSLCFVRRPSDVIYIY